MYAINQVTSGEILKTPYVAVLQPRETMPPTRAMDSDDDFEPSDDGSNGLISETDYVSI